MRSRSQHAIWVVFLFVLAGCNSKPADNAANSAANTASNMAANSMPSSGAAGGSASAPAASPSAATTPMPPPPAPVVIPAGTTLTVRLGEALGSKISSAGQAFTATLSSPVSVDGTTVIPAGARAHGTVVDAKPLGRFKGGAALEVRLTSIVINGTETSIET